MADVRGRTLDVGCGGGRVALHLQSQGTSVSAADSSPLAVRAARARGVRNVRLATVQELGGSVGDFDTLLLFGNNAGIFGGPERLRAVLRHWGRAMGPGARILAESTSPYGGGVPVLDAGYRRANRHKGRMAGQLRLRVRYRRYATPWFSWLFLSPAELRSVVDDTPWRVLRVHSGAVDDPFVAVLENC